MGDRLDPDAEHWITTEMMMKFECIIYEKSQGVAIIKLNRTEVLNAMNKQLWLDFQAALEDAKIDSTIKVLIVTGAGRAFSTGADLKESKTRTRKPIGNTWRNSRKLPAKSSVSKSRRLRPLTDMRLVRATNWPWPVTSGLRPKKPKLVLRKPR